MTSPITLDTISRLLVLADQLGYARPIVTVGPSEMAQLREMTYCGAPAGSFPVCDLVRRDGGDLRQGRRVGISIRPS